MAKPITRFTSTEEFIKCCKYWQHILFLDDWFITFRLTDKKLYMDDKPADGICEFMFDSKEAIITVYNDDKPLYKNVVTKPIGELTLIHELLHLKNEYLLDDDIIGKDENTFHRYINHQALETMAKSLLMTKYNLTPDYFIA